ncbi:hypothetical protein ACKWTF_011824 [Chironomus riparius]
MNNLSADNPSIKHDEDDCYHRKYLDQISENNFNNNASQIDSNALSPIVQINPYYESFDSISMFTESTVPSDFAELEVQAHEYRKNQRQAATASLESELKQQNNIQYNLRFDKVVIVGANEKKDIDIDKPVSEAVNEIITNKVNFEEIPLKYMSVDEHKLFKLLKKKALLIPIICLFLILIGGISFLIYDTLKNEQHEGFSSTTTAEIIKSTTPYDTTSEPVINHKIIKRNDWKTNDSFPITGKYKLISPVNKIILLTTVTSQCDTEESCIEFINEQQQYAYPEYDDIRENFIIALDGTIFEGRGFEREGETTCESDKITCYNNKAISISFVQSSTKDYEVNDKQQSAYCQFIKQKQDMRLIDYTFTAFNHNNLISTTAQDGSFGKLKECCDLHNNIPKIERRNQTIEFIDENLRRMFSTKVIVTSTGGETCNAQDGCAKIVQTIFQQNEIKSNFIFGGDEFIFEDRNFDLAVNESLNDVLLILFIGNYSTSLASQSLITKLNNEFIEYSIVLGKLPSSYKICVTNESKTLINAIRNLNSTKYENFCNEKV